MKTGHNNTMGSRGVWDKLKNSIKSSQKPASSVKIITQPIGLNAEDEWTLNFNEQMSLFLLKLELKRISGRRSQKRMFDLKKSKNIYSKIRLTGRSSGRKTREPVQEDDSTLEARELELLGWEKRLEDRERRMVNEERRIGDQEHGLSNRERVLADRERGIEKEEILKQQMGELEEEDWPRAEEDSEDHGVEARMESERLTEKPKKAGLNIHKKQAVNGGEDEVVVVMEAEEVKMKEKGRERERQREPETDRQREPGTEKKIETQGQNENLAENNKENEALRSQLEDLKDQLGNLKRDRQSRERELLKEQHSAKKQIRAGEKINKGLEEENQKLRLLLEQTGEGLVLERSQKEGYGRQMEDLQRDLQEEQEEGHTLNIQLKDKSKELEAAEASLGQKIRELAESRSQAYDLKNQITHLKEKNNRLLTEMNQSMEPSRLEETTLEPEVDVLKFTQEEYDQHMKRIENIMTANETEKMLLQKELDRLRGRTTELRSQLAFFEEERKREKETEQEEEGNQQKFKRELEVLKDQNKKLFEDNKTLSHKYQTMKKVNKEIKKASDQTFKELNRARGFRNQEDINFDLSETGNPLGNHVLATQVLANDNRRFGKDRNGGKPGSGRGGNPLMVNARMKASLNQDDSAGRPSEGI